MARKVRAQNKRTSGALMAAEAMPTSERLKQAAGAFEIGGDRGGKKVFRMLDAPIERLLLEHKLSDVQYESLRRLRVHYLLGNIAGNLQSGDLDRVRQDQNNLVSTERGLMHREAFHQGFDILTLLQKMCVNSVVLIETEMAVTGAGLGYSSPYRGRLAVLGYLHDAADRMIGVWRRD